MNTRLMNNFLNHNQIRSRGPRRTYSEIYFGDLTRGFALEIRGGRLFEKISRAKIFYKSHI